MNNDKKTFIETRHKKICKQCCKTKTEFPVLKGKEKAICNDCYTKQFGDIFDIEKKIIKKRKETEKMIIEQNQSFVYNLLKESFCEDCKISDFRVLEFDHVYKETKDSNISNLITHGTLKQLKKEIAKCEIRCKNCHSIKTHKENNSWRYKMFLKEEEKNNESL